MTILTGGFEMKCCANCGDKIKVKPIKIFGLDVCSEWCKDDIKADSK
jgi:hypothetical protein